MTASVAQVGAGASVVVAVLEGVVVVLEVVVAVVDVEEALVVDEIVGAVVVDPLSPAPPPQAGDASNKTRTIWGNRLMSQLSTRGVSGTRGLRPDVAT